jgi:hypothetical protein
VAVDISAEVTRTFPTTEVSLSADTDIDYAAEKVRALARAKRQLYGTLTVAAEADIPETAAYWIADQAVVYLIPLAIDYYMAKQRLADSKEGANITFYNKVNALQKLRDELETSLSANRQAALQTIDSSVDGDDDVPAVSARGMAIDPLDRAMKRGPVF